MKRRIFFDTDPAYNCTRIETPFLDKDGQPTFAALPPTAVDVRLVEDTEIPADRTFRNAWNADLSVDMLKARAIARNILRAEREPRFKVLDGQWMRETAKGNAVEAAAIEAKRETMRNWPQDPRIAACAGCEELKAAIATIKSEIVV